MLLNTKRVESLEVLAEKAGPELDFGHRKHEDDMFDYQIFKLLYGALKKDEKKSSLFGIKHTIGKTTNNLSKEDITEFLDLMGEIDARSVDLSEVIGNSVNARKANYHNQLLVRAFKSFEQMIHNSKFVDLHMPKTKHGKKAYAYRWLMRNIIENKERNIELIGYKPKVESKTDIGSAFDATEKLLKDLKENWKQGQIKAR